MGFFDNMICEFQLIQCEQYYQEYGVIVWNQKPANQHMLISLEHGLLALYAFFKE